MKLVKDEQLINHIDVMENNLQDKETRRITLDVSENELYLLSELLDVVSDDDKVKTMWNIIEGLRVKNIQGGQGINNPFFLIFSFT